MIGHPSYLPIQANPLEDFARLAFWQAQVPVTIIPSPQGVTVHSDFGEVIHFPDQTAIQFFLLGFRLGEHTQTHAPEEDPFAVPVVAPEDEEALPGGD